MQIELKIYKIEVAETTWHLAEVRLLCGTETELQHKFSTNWDDLLIKSSKNVRALNHQLFYSHLYLHTVKQYVE